jgi:hypothetical protein
MKTIPMRISGLSWVGKSSSGRNEVDSLFGQSVLEKREECRGPRSRTLRQLAEDFGGERNKAM